MQGSSCIRTLSRSTRLHPGSIFGSAGWVSNTVRSSQSVNLIVKLSQNYNIGRTWFCLFGHDRNWKQNENFVRKSYFSRRTGQLFSFGSRKKNANRTLREVGQNTNHSNHGRFLKTGQSIIRRTSTDTLHFVEFSTLAVEVSDISVCPAGLKKYRLIPFLCVVSYADRQACNRAVLHQQVGDARTSADRQHTAMHRCIHTGQRASSAGQLVEAFRGPFR